MDYDLYVMTGREYLWHTGKAMAFLLLMGFIFYRSIPLSLAICPAAFLYPRRKSMMLVAQRKKQLNNQFRDFLYSLSTCLSAGKSVEAAIGETLRDLSLQYPDPDTPILYEIRAMVGKMELNAPVEGVLQDFAGRSGLEDIQSFADVFTACKRSGGNMVEVIRSTTGILSDKGEIIQEIDTMLSGKKLEGKIMNLMPIALILMLSFASGGYIEPLFVTFWGRVIMTIAMVFLLLSFLISEKITKIEV